MDDMHGVFESVARYFSVLGEPARLRILHTLCKDEKCVNGIIQATGLAQANVSRHLGLMYQAGMLSRRREGTQVFYKVAEPIYVELCRTVSIQLIGRTDGISLRRNRLSHFADEMSPRRSGKPIRPTLSPTQQKEEARV